MDLEVGVRRIENAAQDRARTRIVMAMAAGTMDVVVEDVAGDTRSPKNMLARQVTIPHSISGSRRSR